MKDYANFLAGIDDLVELFLVDLIFVIDDLVNDIQLQHPRKIIVLRDYLAIIPVLIIDFFRIGDNLYEIQPPFFVVDDLINNVFG